MMIVYYNFFFSHYLNQHLVTTLGLLGSINFITTFPSLGPFRNTPVNRREVEAHKAFTKQFRHIGLGERFVIGALEKGVEDRIKCNLKMNIKYESSNPVLLIINYNSRVHYGTAVRNWRNESKY
jgi:hypothetical protein